MNIESILSTLKSLSAEELDEILDKRDQNPFDSAWCKTNEIIQGNETSPNQEAMFKQISKITKGHEIASYIIDDINLIYRAKSKNIKNEFINNLSVYYKNGEIPHTCSS